MAAYGRNHEVLAHHSAVLEQHVDNLRGVVAEVDSILGATHWVGQTRDSLSNSWLSGLRAAVTELAELLDAAAGDCALRAADRGDVLVGRHITMDLMPPVGAVEIDAQARLDTSRSAA
jgi:hypothetical protein